MGEVGGSALGLGPRGEETAALPPNTAVLRPGFDGLVESGFGLGPALPFGPGSARAVGWESSKVGSSVQRGRWWSGMPLEASRSRRPFHSASSR